MGWKRKPGLIGRPFSGVRGARLLSAAVFTALIGVLTACGGTSAPKAVSATGTAQATPSATSAPTASAAAAGAAAFTDIVEPFDPGHPARNRPAPASCDGQVSTLAIVQCYETQTENADAAIDAAQLARYQSASQAGQAAIVAADGGWLAARQPVCDLSFKTGGTIDEINIGACLLDESTARLDAVRGITPPEATLKATDNTGDGNAPEWYTTPGGSRITMVDTQGDQSGGAVIAWTIIGGADGFTVNPRQFYFLDNSFTDDGVVQPPSNSGLHHVATGAEYEFSIDYTHLSADPNAAKGAGGYVYAPGTPVAIWR